MPGILQAIASFTSTGAASWSFRSVGTASVGPSPTIALPAGHVSGDLLIIAIAGESVNITTPAGWTASTNQTVSPRLCVFYKFDGGAESAVVISGGGPKTIGVMLCFTGGTAVDVNGTLSTTLTTTSLTTLAANDLIISVYANSTSASTWTGTPASTTVRYDSAGTGAVDALLVVSETQAGAGASATRTATNSSVANTASMAVSFKL